MKRLVSSLGFVTIVALSVPAIAQDRAAEYDLYANRGGKAFSFERSFPSLAACAAAAKSLYESNRVRGAGCKPTPPPAAMESTPDPNVKKKASAEERKALERPR